MWDYLRLWLGGRRGFFTHIHHEGVPIEYSWDILERLNDIDAYKPPEERALRKALIRRVPDRMLPPSLLKAEKEYWEAEAAKVRARRKYARAPFGSVTKREASEEYGAAERAHSSAEAVFDEERDRVEWNEIHAKVCHPNCPWTPSKRNIFSRGNSSSIKVLKG